MIAPLFMVAQSTTHTVGTGETFYSIAKMYNTTVDEIKANNPNIDQNNITIGTVLNIYAKPASANTAYNSSNGAAVYHTVAKGETLFGLAKRTYNVSVEELKSWNNLTNNALSVGQSLIVGWASDTQNYTENTVTTNSTYPATSTYQPAATTTTTTVNSTTPVSEGKIVYVSKIPGRGELNDLKDSRTVYTSGVTSTSAITNSSDKYATTSTIIPGEKIVSDSYTEPVDKVINNDVDSAEATSTEPDIITEKYGSIAAGNNQLPREIFKSLEASNDSSLALKKEEGVAKWFELDDKSIQMYALHASAPIGSALKITNPIDQTTIYVKVIDILPPTDENASTLLRLSSNAMSILKMFDKAFMVNVEYFDVVNK